MAKMTVTADSNLDDIKLESSDKLESKEKEKNNKKKNKSKKTTKKNKKRNYILRVIDEIKPVTWTSKKNLIKYSLITIIIILFLMAFFIGISALFDLVYALVQGWWS